MNDFDSEIIEKAKSAESVEELLEIAKANNVEITAEDASAYFAQLNPRCGELADDELDNVAGGGCSSTANGGLAPAEPQLCAGQKVYLKEPGHTFGSCYCQNPTCASPVFWIEKQIDAEKYLLQCNGCDWTYHAVKDNIVAL